MECMRGKKKDDEDEVIVHLFKKVKCAKSSLTLESHLLHTHGLGRLGQSSSREHSFKCLLIYV
jgi:hypothetical protein